MGLFTKTKKDDKKKTDDKSVKVDSGAKVVEKKVSTKDLYGNKDVKSDKSSDKKIEKSTGSKKHGNAYKVLVKPLLTEKATILNAENKYLFEVDIKANKVEVKKAIKEVYGIVPTSVNMIKYDGKKVRHGRTTGRKKSWKKAIVTLPKGKTINIYEGV